MSAHTAGSRKGGQVWRQGTWQTIPRYRGEFSRTSSLSPSPSLSSSLHIIQWPTCSPLLISESIIGCGCLLRKVPYYVVNRASITKSRLESLYKFLNITLYLFIYYFIFKNGRHSIAHHHLCGAGGVLLLPAVTTHQVAQN